MDSTVSSQAVVPETPVYIKEILESSADDSVKRSLLLEALDLEMDKLLEEAKSLEDIKENLRRLSYKISQEYKFQRLPEIWAAVQKEWLASRRTVLDQRKHEGFLRRHGQL